MRSLVKDSIDSARSIDIFEVDPQRWVQMSTAGTGKEIRFNPLASYHTYNSSTVTLQSNRSLPLIDRGASQSISPAPQSRLSISV